MHQTTAPSAAQTAEIADNQANPRMLRIYDYLQESLAKINPFDANLGVVNSDLLVFARRIKHVLDEAMRQGPTSLEEMEALLPMVDIYLKIAKQIEHFSQLAIKLDKHHANPALNAFAAADYADAETV